MSEHTKGPWNLDFDTISTLPRRKGKIIAITFAGNMPGFKANGLLIAAAPDLLEACEAIWQLIEKQELVRNTKGDGEMRVFAKQGLEIVKGLSLLQQAISKATGKE